MPLKETNIKLNEKNLVMLQKIIKARLIMGWILNICTFFLFALSIAPSLLGETMPTFLYFFDAIYFLIFIWSIIIIKEQSQNRKKLNKLCLFEITGKAKKIGRAVAVPAGGATHIAQLKQGLIRIENKTYGTIPGLFELIDDEKENTYKIALISFGGISGIIMEAK